jgi:DNA-binding NarL/FixJ family response regulator
MLTTFDEKELVAEAMRAGAKGFILKQRPIADVIHDIKAVYHGSVLISAPAADKLDWGADERGAGTSAPVAPEARRILSGLSERDRSILHCMLEGLDNKAIAEKAGVSEGTARNYVSRIYQTVGVHNRTALLLWAMRNDIR